MAGRITGMMLEGHDLAALLELFKDKKGFYNLTEEAISLIASNSESAK